MNDILEENREADEAESPANVVIIREMERDQLSRLYSLLTQESACNGKKKLKLRLTDTSRPFCFSLTVVSRIQSWTLFKSSSTRM